MKLTKEKLFLEVQDFSVTKEKFGLYYNSDYDMLITDPQPEVSELAKYYESEDYISHTDNKRSFFEKMYQFVKSITLKSKLKLINTQSKKGKLLDIGAGTGDFLSYAKNDGWECFGIEPSEKAKNIANKKGVEFVNSMSDLKDNSFDVITMWHVLEHVSDLDLQIKELKRVLKSNGTLIIAVPNYKSYDANYYKENWAAFDVPRHLWHFSKKSIQNLFERQNFKLIKIMPMIFDSFYVCLLSEKYKSGKMNFIKAFIIGLKSNLFGIRKNEYSSHIYILKKH